MNNLYEFGIPITKFKESSDIKAVRAASLATQKTVEYYFDKKPDTLRDNENTYGIISPEIVEIEGSFYLVLFSSLVENFKLNDINGVVFKDYQSKISFCIGDLLGAEGYTSCRVILEGENSLQINSPLSIRVFSLKKIEQSAKILAYQLLENNHDFFTKIVDEISEPVQRFSHRSGNEVASALLDHFVEGERAMAEESLNYYLQKDIITKNQKDHLLDGFTI